MGGALCYVSHLFSCLALIMHDFCMAIDFCCLHPPALPVYTFLSTIMFGDTN